MSVSECPLKYNTVTCLGSCVGCCYSFFMFLLLFNLNIMTVVFYGNNATLCVCLIIRDVCFILTSYFICDSMCVVMISFLLLSFVCVCRPVTEMVQDIHQGNWLRFGAGKLKELCKLLPEKNEVRDVNSQSEDSHNVFKFWLA